MDAKKKSGEGSGGKSGGGASGGGRKFTRTGTPIFEQAPQASHSPGSGAQAREIAREQGQQLPTPQRDHERERNEVRPASASSRAPESNVEGVKNQAGGVQSGADEDMPLRPPGGHGEAADIDDAHDPR